ncbi:hypothetical protein [Streptomyces spiralis]|uniref:hypothetical protein n=1 Tax=Streptomyces spiralis TaxID=66376 RepID=UPI00369A46C3
MNDGDWVFDEYSRRVLAEVADILIPAGSGLASARQVGVHTHLVDRVLAVRPDLAPRLARALSACAGQPPSGAVMRLRAQRPELFEALTEVVAGGYLMSQQVADQLHYPWQEAKPVDSGAIVQILHEGLLDDVVARGPLYRLPPDAPDGAKQAMS